MEQSPPRGVLVSDSNQFTTLGTAPSVFQLALGHPRKPLQDWERRFSVPIHIWHVFFDMAYGIPFKKAESLIKGGYIEPTVQIFQAPGGATTQKTIYKIYYQHAYLLGESTHEPRLVADYITDKNGHILPYVRFEGGKLRLHREALEVLREAADGAPQKPSG